MDFDADYPFPSCNEDDIMAFFAAEKNYMVRRYYVTKTNMILRRMGLHSILANSRNESLDAFTTYLAMNFFDRYHSKKTLLVIEGEWVSNVTLVAIACLTLVSKMRKSGFSLSGFANRKNITLDEKTKIAGFELDIFKSMGWRMEPITPFNYARYLVDELGTPYGVTSKTLGQIIVETQDNARFTLFKPSIISASALLCALWHLYPDNYGVYEERLKRIRQLDQNELQECVTLLKEMCFKKRIWMETTETDESEGMRRAVPGGTQWHSVMAAFRLKVEQYIPSSSPPKSPTITYRRRRKRARHWLRTT